MKRDAVLTNRVAAVREQRGLSAAALAQAVGISRQAIYAVEAGTYMPNTATSLRLARALGVKVDELFTLADLPPESAGRFDQAALVPGDQPLQTGQPVQLCRLNGRLVASAAEPAAWCLPAQDGIVADAGRVQVHQHEEHFNNRVLLAGCDPAMGRVARYLESTKMQLLLLHQNSSRSLKLLRDGYVHVAGCHLGNSNIKVVKQLFPAKSAALISFAVWQEGLVTAAGNPKDIKNVADVARPDVLFVNREEGAGSRALLDRHLKQLGIDSRKVRGYHTLSGGHLAAAGEVKKGSADCCVSTEATARFLGLHFIPLESIRYDLTIRAQQLSDPAVNMLLDSMNRLAFRRMLGSIGGYDTSVTGNRVI
jgi:molybdate-binding protein/DNA-binding XRE family transcriptional regulator